MHVIWTGARVRLRPFSKVEEGLELVKQIHGELIPHWGPRWERPLEQARAYEDAGWCGVDNCTFAIDRLDIGQLVGYEFVRLPAVGSLGAWIATYIQAGHQRQGFGIEAKQLAMCFVFENFPAERIGAVTPSTHLHARRGLERCGMHYEGRRVRSWFSNARWVDRTYYVIFREEWERLPVRQLVKRGAQPE